MVASLAVVQRQRAKKKNNNNNSVQRTSQRNHGNVHELSDAEILTRCNFVAVIVSFIV